MKKNLLFAASIALLALNGCSMNSTKLMLPTTTKVVAAANEATVTFYRPDDGSSYYCPIVTQTGPISTQFIATIAKAQKYTVALPAGQHVFAFLGEENHILQGYFREGKHYYVKLNFSEGLYGSIFKPTIHATNEHNVEKTLGATLSNLTAIEPTDRAYERYKTPEEVRKAIIGIKEAKTRAVAGENAFVSKENAFDKAL